MKKILFWFPVIILLFAACTQQFRLNAFQYKIKKNISCSKGAVVSAHALASEAGVGILKQGGNAIDAAITTQLVLAVVYPGAGNIGGGGFMVAHLQKVPGLDTTRNIAIDYREKAPGKADRDMYLDSSGNAVLDLSQNGRLAAGVPGTVAGIFASMKYASFPFSKLIAPAIMLAEKGFAVSEAEASSLNRYRDDFIKYNSEIPAFVKSSPWKGGDTLVQTQLASTLKRIRDKGAAGFYEGETAQYIVSEMKQGNGIISLDDLKNYEVKFRQPVSFDYKGFNVLSMPMPSSGGLLLKQMMKMVEHRNLEASGFGTVATIHLMTEVERRAFADRAKFMGDRDYVRVPITTLGSDIYLQNRMKDFDPDLAGKSVDIQPGNIATESDETTHLSVIDEHGNAVSVTTTLNGGYGSRTVVSGAGFLLNNEMDDFSAKPGVANMYGAVGDEANAIAPGKRMLSSMTPAIVLKNNEPWIITGTPGGTTIPTSVFQTLIDLIDFNMTPEEAIMKPKFHHQWLPDQIIMEPGFDSEIVSKLEAMGHTITTVRAIGRVEVIMQKEKNKIVAAADVRGEDAAAGY